MTCQRCNGTRVTHSDAWRRWWAENQHRPLAQQTPPPSERPETTCPDCLGLDRPLTEGERVVRNEILRFIAQVDAG
jgi:hypothetical protein